MKKLPMEAPLPRLDENAILPTKSKVPNESQNQTMRYAPAVSFTGKVKRSKRKIVSILIIALLFLILAYAFCTLTLYARLAPQLSELGISEAEREIRQRINNEILLLCESGELNGEKLIKPRRNAAGKIVSVETDATEMNRMRAVLVDRLTKTLENKRGFILSVPAGSLTDSGILSWMSLPIRVKYTPLGSVSGDILTEFSDSGVNQTKYSVSAEVRISYLLLLPGNNPRSEAVSRVLLGEIIIVGDVPQWVGKAT